MLIDLSTEFFRLVSETLYASTEAPMRPDIAMTDSQIPVPRASLIAQSFLGKFSQDSPVYRPFRVPYMCPSCDLRRGSVR